MAELGIVSSDAFLNIIGEKSKTSTKAFLGWMTSHSTGCADHGVGEWPVTECFYSWVVFDNSLSRVVLLENMHSGGDMLR